MYSTYKSDFRTNPVQPEYGKFIQLNGDTNFPSISVVQVAPAFDSAYSSQNQLLSTTTVYPKYALLAYVVNAADAAGGGTVTPTGSAGFSTVSTYFSSTSGTALLANTSRNFFYIQNLDVVPLLLSLGPVCSAGATGAAFNAILQASTAFADGKGGVWQKDYNYKGMVTVASTAGPGVSAKYIAWEA